VGLNEAWLIVDIEGESDAIQQALHWAKGQGIEVQALTEV
jgi:DNA-binding MurR/RpiR family transcriptional regulator